MEFSKSIIDIIRERTSRRTYSGQPLEKDIKEKVKIVLKNSVSKGPFSKIAGNIRFELVGISDFELNEQKRLNLRVIEGAQDFIIGAIEDSQYNREYYGYTLETIILAVTDMGLGTCWLGGFFNRRIFSAKIMIAPNEIVPAITPIGYYAKRTPMELKIRSLIKADERIPWNNLFFNNNFSTPLTEEQAGKYSTLLKMVQLGPSASNRQPWRLIKELDKDIFHFYIICEKNNKINDFSRIDIGIAVSHFNFSAKELGIKGKWEFKEPNIPDSKRFSYIITWNGQK